MDGELAGTTFRPLRLHRIYRFLKHGAEKEGTAIAVDDVAKLGGAKLVAEVQQARNLLRPVNVGPANTDGHEARSPARL